MGSRVQPKILAAGIELFADFGYYGVTTRDLAKKAKTTEASLYRLFETKEKLFERALQNVIDHSLDPGQFLLALFDKAQSGKQDFASVMSAVLRRWYDSLERKAARLLTQAYFVKPKLRHIAASPYAPIDKIIEILAAAITREHRPHPEKVNAKTAATAIILTLLHFKITSASSCTSKQEAEMVGDFIQFWLQGLS